MIILIGNKADLEAQRDVTYEEAKQFAEENGEECVCVTLWYKYCLCVCEPEDVENRSLNDFYLLLLLRFAVSRGQR